MASLKPLRDKVVVERNEAEERTAGGIVLPDSAKDKPKQGTVVAVGTGRVLDNGPQQALDFVEPSDSVKTVRTFLDQEFARRAWLDFPQTAQEILGGDQESGKIGRARLIGAARNR